MHGHGSQWISYKISIRHPLQLKKSKYWEPFRSYQLNSTANPAHLPQNWAKFEVNGLDWQCCLAGISKRAPRIFIFSIVLGAENLLYVKSIETHARAFLPLNISAICTVQIASSTTKSVCWQRFKGQITFLLDAPMWPCKDCNNAQVWLYPIPSLKIVSSNEW